MGEGEGKSSEGKASLLEKEMKKGEKLYGEGKKKAGL